MSCDCEVASPSTSSAGLITSLSPECAPSASASCFFSTPLYTILVQQLPTRPIVNAHCTNSIGNLNARVHLALSLQDSSLDQLTKKIPSPAVCESYPNSPQYHALPVSKQQRKKEPTPQVQTDWISTPRQQRPGDEGDEGAYGRRQRGAVAVQGHLDLDRAVLVRTRNGKGEERWPLYLARRATGSGRSARGPRGKLGAAREVNAGVRSLHRGDCGGGRGGGTAGARVRGQRDGTRD
uniref:Uncharacterized protein n=1 Tax=Arundo donax TaxID=35708 RepID=A0A0A8ZV47_ARUDO